VGDGSGVREYNSDRGRSMGWETGGIGGLRDIWRELGIDVGAGLGRDVAWRPLGRQAEEQEGRGKTA